MGATLQEVRDRIVQAAKIGPLAENVSDVQIEPDSDEDGDDFLRIVIVWRAPDRDVDAELEALVERIEESVSAIDDRYPSVRFLDAA